MLRLLFCDSLMCGDQVLSRLDHALMAWACDPLASSEILESPCQLFVLAVVSSAARNPFAGLSAYLNPRRAGEAELRPRMGSAQIRPTN
jgi:hypothetical protein